MTNSTGTIGKVGKIKCKHCDTVWEGVQEYLSSNGCNKEECPMAKKWKARQAANAAIEAAKESSREEVFVCHTKECHMDQQHDESLPYRERPMSKCISFHVMKR